MQLKWWENQRPVDTAWQSQKTKLMEKENNLQEQTDELLSKNLYLESYSRRENVKFFSIPEEVGENTEDI